MGNLPNTLTLVTNCFLNHTVTGGPWFLGVLDSELTQVDWVLQVFSLELMRPRLLGASYMRQSQEDSDWQQFEKDQKNMDMMVSHVQ